MSSEKISMFRNFRAGSGRSSTMSSGAGLLATDGWAEVAGDVVQQNLGLRQRRLTSEGVHQGR